MVVVVAVAVGTVAVAVVGVVGVVSAVVVGIAVVFVVAVVAVTVVVVGVVVAASPMDAPMNSSMAASPVARSYLRLEVTENPHCIWMLASVDG